MAQSPPSPSEPEAAAEGSRQVSSSSRTSSKSTTPARPTALLARSWTSAASTSTTSSRITVGANTSTAADSGSRSHAASTHSSASTRASTPLPDLAFRASTPQPPADAHLADLDEDSKVQVSTSASASDAASGEGAFQNAGGDDEPEAVGITASSSIHALDLLHRVNDKAAADRASHGHSVRSRLSQLSVSRVSSSRRSRSNSVDVAARVAKHAAAPEDQAETLPDHAGLPSSDDIRPAEPNLADTSAYVEAERYPDRKYYILSSAGKPIYISHASLARRRRHREKRRQQSTPPQQPDDAASGSPCADSDEEDESSTTQVGVMQALISIFADEDSDKLRFIRQGDLLIVFLLRAPLYLVCVSSWSEEPSTLRQHLEYLYLQVVSLVSASQLTRLFARMPNFDLRRLLEGTEGIFDYLVNQLNANNDDANMSDWACGHQWWLQALQPIRITVPNLRDQLTAALQPPVAEEGKADGQVCRPKDLLYVLLVANGRIVTLLRPRKHSVHPIDLLLLTNTVMGSRSIKTSGDGEAEVWMPFSMPKFAPQGFVHAYVKFLDPESWTSGNKQGERMTSSELAVIVVTADKDAFPTVSNWISSLVAKPPTSSATPAVEVGKSKGKSKARHEGWEGDAWMTSFQRHILVLCRHLLDPLNLDQGGPRVSAYTCTELGLAGLRHFVYRSNSTIQLTSPLLPEPYSTCAPHRKRLFTLYALVHHNIHNPIPSSSPEPTTQIASALGLASSTSANPKLTTDTRMKMQLLKSHHEQVLGWITAPFELYLCVNPQLSKSAIVAIANTLTKWIKSNERDLFLVNAGSF